MTSLDEMSYKSGLSPWGTEVQKRLLDRRLERKYPCEQKDLVKYLNDNGFSVSKGCFSALLRGVGVSKRMSEIAAVNEILEIVVR